MASRRRSRVQGGWASGAKAVSSKITAGNASSSSTDDKRLHQMTVARPEQFSAVSYLENTTEIRKKPDELVIREDGEHILSTGPSGISKITLNSSYMAQSDADHLLAVLSEELPWELADDKRYGAQPRLTLWYGDQPYAYSGVMHPAKTDWHPSLESMRHELELVTGERLNSVACILYRDGHDSIAWHSDDEAVLGTNPFIASISLGDTRVFEMRKKPVDGSDDYSYCQHVRLHVTHGCLLTMQQSTQTDWQHRVPKEYHDRKPRINLTFRRTVPL